MGLSSYLISYIFLFGSMGAIFPLASQYFASAGFSGSQIGTITATGTFVAIFSTMLWGYVYNESKNKHSVLAFLCLASGVICVLIPQISSYVLVILVYALFYFFHQSLNPLADAMTMMDGQDFNFIRMWGAIGYAFAVFVGGRLATEMGEVVIFYIAIVCLAAAALIVFRIGKVRRKALKLSGEQNTETENAEIEDIENIEGRSAGVTNKGYSNKGFSKFENFMALFRNKKYMLLLISCFFIGGTNIGNNTYFSFLYKDGGGDLAGVGLAMLFMVGSEAPFMVWAAKLSKKFGIEKVILVSMIISVVRFAWYGTGPSCTALTVMFFLQGMVNGIILVELVRYVAKLVETKYMGLAISIFYVVFNNLSGIVCQAIGGAILDSQGSGGVYTFFALFNLVGVILYVLFGLNKK